MRSVSVPLPLITKPGIRMPPPVPTIARVEILTSRAVWGPAVGMGVGDTCGVGVGVGAGVGVGVGMGVGVGVGPETDVGVGLGVGVAVGVGVGVGDGATPPVTVKPSAGYDIECVVGPMPPYS
jgi:hypothetical protein